MLKTRSAHHNSRAGSDTVLNAQILKQGASLLRNYFGKHFLRRRINLTKAGVHQAGARRAAIQ